MNNQKAFAFFIFIAIFLSPASARCRYNIDENFLPFHVDTQPFQLGVLSACKDFIAPGRLGCCNNFNDQTTLKNFKQIDGIFGLQGGGCDVCAINLKRFWCEYACSARHDEFMDTATEYQPFPDPQKPGSIIWGQRVNVRVHVDTACALYNSCKRNSFVASVSAMGSPAGFLNFQGHNAINDGHQFISMNFSYNLNDSLAFDDSLNDFACAALTTCDYRTSEPEVHNFTFGANCTCNTCEEACDSSHGYVYEEAEVLEGFNYMLVGGVYAFAILLAGGLTVYRSCSKKRKEY